MDFRDNLLLSDPTDRPTVSTVASQGRRLRPEIFVGFYELYDHMFQDIW